MPCRELISCLSECCNCYELRYVRDMMVSIVKRKVKQSVGPLVERKGGSNLKDNLLKDVYNLYSFGEGSVQSLPKNMIKCDTKYVNQSTETDACSSNTIFASKLDLDTLNDEPINRISDLRHEMLNTNLLSRSSVPITLLSSHSQSTVPDTLSSTQLDQLLSLKIPSFLYSPDTLSLGQHHQVLLRGIQIRNLMKPMMH